MGLSAYGVKLGINEDTINENIEYLEKESESPEVKERLKVVNRTIERHKEGERVAWRKWYELAGVEPPVGIRVVPYEVFLKLKAFEDKLLLGNPKGMGGFTDLDVLTELVEVGRRYGEPHPSRANLRTLRVG